MLVVMSDTTQDRGVLAFCHRGKGSGILLSFPSQHLAWIPVLLCPKPDQGVIRVNSNNSAMIVRALLLVLCFALLWLYDFSWIALSFALGVGLRLLWESYKKSLEGKS